MWTARGRDAVLSPRCPPRGVALRILPRTTSVSPPKSTPLPVSMRFTISREKLQEGLGAVAASIPAKTTLPVLSNILVETTDRGIRLSGTDLDIAVSTEVAADVETAGAITIPAKKLSEIARELPPSPVKIAAAGEQRVTLDCGRSHFKILGLPEDEFPHLPAGPI